MALMTILWLFSALTMIDYYEKREKKQNDGSIKHIISGFSKKVKKKQPENHL